MVINVGRLEKDSQMKVELCEEICLPESYSKGDKPLVKLDAVVSNVNGKYILKGMVNTVLTLECDKCLSLFKEELSFDIDEVYERFENKSDDESYGFEGSRIDLNDMLISNIVLNIPMKAVCSEDCKGLCYKCGQNLNISECGCDRAYVNPYFEGINSFFDDKEV